MNEYVFRDQGKEYCLHMERKQLSMGLGVVAKLLQSGREIGTLVFSPVPAHCGQNEFQSASYERLLEEIVSVVPDRVPVSKFAECGQSSIKGLVSFGQYT